MTEKQRQWIAYAIVVVAILVAGFLGVKYPVPAPPATTAGSQAFIYPPGAIYFAEGGKQQVFQSGSTLTLSSGSTLASAATETHSGAVYASGGLFSSSTIGAGGAITTTTTDNAGTSGYGVYSQITQSDSVTMTGTLRGIYAVATNGQIAATGAVRGAEIKARAADPGNVGADVDTLTGVYLSADAKNKTATTLRGLEVSLDGGAGGASTTAQGVVVFNNSSASQTSSYAVDVNGGTASGHKAFTADLRLQNGETIDNATDGTVNIGGTSPVLAIGAVSFTGPIKYGVAATYTSGAAITHGFAAAPTACFMFPSRDVTETITIGTTTFSSNRATMPDPVYWMCGK